MKNTLKRKILVSIMAGMIASSGAMVYAQNPVPVVTSYHQKADTLDRKVLLGSDEIKYDVPPSVINGKTMLPVRATAEKLGYAVKWNPDSKSIELSKGAQWTSVKVGENSYFKNKMAPSPLSAAPEIVQGRCMVPVEVFTHILSWNVSASSGDIAFNENQFAEHSGYIQKIEPGKNSKMVYISPEKSTTDIEKMTIIHVNSNTIVNADLDAGNFIYAHCLPIMTASIPGQTSADLVFEATM
jgi:hypothetical protein